jgi:hypothetical protein
MPKPFGVNAEVGNMSMVASFRPTRLRDFFTAAETKPEKGVKPVPPPSPPLPPLPGPLRKSRKLHRDVARDTERRERAVS